MLKALIFDFDGLILDTETPEVLVWQSIYKEHGFELPVTNGRKRLADTASRTLMRRNISRFFLRDGWILFL